MAKTERQNLLLANCRVPSLHIKRDRNEMLAHPQWSKAYKLAETIVDAGTFCVLLGDRGNGKTQAAVELIRRSCILCKPAKYYRIREVGMALRRAYDNTGMSEDAALRLFTDPYLLVLDECQERPEKEWEMQQLTLILDIRYGEQRPTVLIANAKPEVFTKMMGPAVTDRIHEGGRAITFNWQSFRRQASDPRT